MTIGIVADTHGFVPKDAMDYFERAGVELILHAGDIGGMHVIDALDELAPVVAVAGNGDEPISHRLPWDLRLHLEARRVFLCHWYNNYGRIHPEYARVVDEWQPHVLVHGHTHEAVVEKQSGTLFLNPGYAGPPEPSRERTAALLDVATLDAHIITL